MLQLVVAGDKQAEIEQKKRGKVVEPGPGQLIRIRIAVAVLGLPQDLTMDVSYPDMRPCGQPSDSYSLAPAQIIQPDGAPLIHAADTAVP